LSLTTEKHASFSDLAMQASEADLKTVVTHVFMPPDLPNNWGDSDQRAESNNVFFGYFRDFLLGLSEAEGPFEGVPSLLLPALESVLQPPSEADVLARLEGLKERDFWLYLGLRTCLLQFRSVDGRLSVAGYDLHPSQKGCAGDVQHPLAFSDDPIPVTAQVAMPRLTIWACAQQVQQLAFARQLVDLKVIPDLPGSIPKIRKANQKVQEPRQLAMPIHLFEWLFPFVALEAQTEPEPFFKKVNNISFLFSFLK